MSVKMNRIFTLNFRNTFFGIVVLAFSCARTYASDTGEALKTSLAPMLGTISVRFEPYMTEGRLEGCTLVFSVLALDNKYGMGDYLNLSGNIGILNFNGYPGANLKLVVNRMDFETQPVSFKPSPPSRAYLIKNDFSTTLTKGQKNFPAETPGGLFTTFDVVMGLEFISYAIANGKINIGFNQKNGKSDIVTALDLDVIDTDNQGKRKRSAEQINRFSECLQSVADSIEK
jgi:hypothetical protein